LIWVDLSLTLSEEMQIIDEINQKITKVYGKKLLETIKKDVINMVI
jgi:hypothetical protein